MSRFPAQDEEETGIDEGVVGFEDLSDEALVNSAGTSPPHLVALHERYRGLVSALMAQRAVSQRIWFNIFEILERDPQSLLPVEDKLAQMVEKLFGGRMQTEETVLPDPLAWYLHRVLSNIPQPLRIILLLVEVEQRTPEEIAAFFAERQFAITTSALETNYAQAKNLLVEGLPTVVRNFYFDGAIDCLSLTPWLSLEMAEEIRDFDAWQQTQTSPLQSPTASANQRWWMAIPVALALLVIGAVASQPRQPIQTPKVLALPTKSVPQRLVVPSAPTWSGRMYLLVAEPGSEGFAKLKSIDPGIYYRQYQGLPYVQVGVFSTRNSAESTAVKVRQLGFKPIFTPASAP